MTEHDDAAVAALAVAIGMAQHHTFASFDPPVAGPQTHIDARNVLAAIQSDPAARAAIHAATAPEPGTDLSAKSYNDAYIAGLIEGMSRAEDIVEAARLVAQWHGAIGSGPVEVLDEELGALASLCASYDEATHD